MADRIRLGPVYWICGIVLALVITFGLVFLEIVPWELLGPTFTIAWGGGQIAIIVAGRVGLTREGIFSGFVMVAAMGALLLMIFENILISNLFGVETLAVDKSNAWIVNVLFAIYEETFFLGVRVAGKAGGLPDMYVVLLEVVAFVPYHALRYPLETLFFVVFLAVVRITLSVVSLMTDHSDPPYIAHMLYNFIASVV